MRNTLSICNSFVELLEEMPQFISIDAIGKTTSVRMAAIRLKSANSHIFRALLSLASAAVLIRMFGMLNQVVVSSRFGAGATMDAYFVASALPLLLAQLMISAIEAAVIPVYARVRSQGDKEQASLLFSTILNLLLVGTALLSLIMFIFHQQLILFSAPALDPLRRGIANSLAPIIDPVLLLMVVIGFLECILNTEGQFGWPAYAGLLVPLTTAILVLTVGSSLGVIMLCIGMIAGLCLQLCAFIFRARRAGLTYRLVLDIRSAEIRTILISAWPVLIGALIGQASPLVDQMFASFLTAGSISALSYSLKIISVFSGVIFTSAGRAALPYLSRQAAIKDFKSFKETLRLYLWIVGIGTGVLSAILLIFAHPIVHILFQRGAFSSQDTDRTSVTLMGFAIGLMPMALAFITSKAFSALGKNKVLMWVSTFSVFANAVFDAIFAHFWQSFGIALATSGVYACTMCLLIFALYRIIGKLHFLTPPSEIVTMIQKISVGNYYPKWLTMEGNTISAFSYDLRRQVVRVGVMITVFAVGIIGIFLNSLYTLRMALGSIIILAFLRYRYALLITWVMLDAFIGSTISIFNGNNFDTGLSLSTLLLMAFIPVQETFKRMTVLAFLLVYLLWVFAGIGISPIGGGAFLTQWILLLDYVAVAVLAIQVLTTQQRLMRFIDLIMLPSTFIALYGIYGYFTKQNGQVDPTTSLFRIYSIFSASPAAALSLSIIIPLAIYRASSLKGFRRVGNSILVIIFFVALAFTFTRAAFISLPLSIFILILFLPSRRVKIGLFSGILVLAVIAFLLAQSGNIPIFNRFFNQDISTFNNRTYLWQALLNHFDPRQLLGYGFRASDTLIVNLGLGNFGTSPSNLFIGVLYDQGIIGLALLIIVFIALFISLIKGIRKTSGDQRALFVVALATFVNMLVQSFDANDLWTQAIGLYFWIIMALPFAICWSSSKQSNITGEEMFDKATETQIVAIQQAEREHAAMPGFMRQF